MKKFLIAIIVMTSVFILIGCRGGHEHSYEVYTYDEIRHSITCECGDNVVENHKFGEWVIIDEPTIESYGKSYRICTVCEFKESKEVPMLEHTHTYGKWEIGVAPTRNSVGHLVRKCLEYPDHIQEINLPRYSLK